jgi:metallo-beta-lactamase family protein
VLRFLGAAGTVTGSRFLLENQDDRLLVDAGLYQGRRELRRRNWEPFPVPPALLGSVALTHAHLDHTGYLPRLVREGFAGEVVCTPETAALAAIVLRDSAHLQEEDARYANEAGWSVHHPALPLYTNVDVEQALTQIRAVPFGRRRPHGFRPPQHSSSSPRTETGGTDLPNRTGSRARSDAPPRVAGPY